MATAFQSNAFQTSALAFQIDGSPPPTPSTTPGGGSAGGRHGRHYTDVERWSRREGLQRVRAIGVPLGEDRRRVARARHKALVRQLAVAVPAVARRRHASQTTIRLRRITLGAQGIARAERALGQASTRDTARQEAADILAIAALYDEFDE